MWKLWLPIIILFIILWYCIGSIAYAIDHQVRDYVIAFLVLFVSAVWGYQMARKDIGKRS